jgi:cell division septal protein FtsQ
VAARRRARSTTRAGAVALPRGDARVAKLLPSRGSVLVGLAVFACAAGAYAAARESPLFAVEAVQVRGGTPLVRQQVAKALDGELGVALLKIDGGVIDRRLAGVPWVAAASYDRAFPHTLVVTVRPERPVAVLRRGSKSWLVSARGRVVADVPRGAERALPRIWIGAKAAPPELGSFLPDTQGGSAARALAPLSSVHFPARVASVVTGQDELTLVLRSGLALRLGDPGDLRLKLAVARRVLALLPAAGAGAYVDVSVPERPVASVNPQLGG